MKIINYNQQILEGKVLDLINECRGRVLDVVEAQLGTTPNWKIIRGQLLNLLGEKGLSGEVQIHFKSYRNSGF